jgi:hypothetical protein
MNWRRGFFRIWVVLSALWIVFMNLAAYYKFIVPRMNGADVGPISADIPQYLGIVFGPVLFVLVIGAVVTWMLSGFKRA